ncbi:MAG: FAD-dependent oxidoreductase [Chitinophagaceae bacterium]
MAKVIIIGGGIIGLSSAWFLQKSGHQVTVIDKSDMVDGCSYGNAGYVCPSHFVPMASPGIVKQGLKWMLNAKSPFYIQPRPSLSLIDWGLKFMKHATANHVNNSAVPLRDIALLSQGMYENWARQPQFDFSYQHKGLLEIFQTEANTTHAAGAVDKARELGLDVSLFDMAELQNLEPGTRINAKGAILFKCDAHLNPNRLMHDLKAGLQQKGVNFILNEEIDRFEMKAGKIHHVGNARHQFEADYVVVATGSWSRNLVARLNLRLPLMPGRGYSVTLDDTEHRLNYPAILVEGRVAITPLSPTRMRYGGTMEITTTNARPDMNRVKGLLKTVKDFFPDFDIPLPPIEKVWWGYRPCSADGLPYIGKLRSPANCIIATGHSMLGLSLGAGTGKVVDELVNEQNTSVDISAFDPERFN